MSDFGNFETVFAEAGGWGVEVALGGDETLKTASEPTFDYPFGYGMPTNVTNNVFGRIEERSGSEYDKTPGSKDQLSEDNSRILREAYRNIQFDVTPTQTNQDPSDSYDDKNIKLLKSKLDQDSKPFNSETKVSISTADQESINQEKVVQDQQKGFFNKWVIGGFALGAVLVVGLIKFALPKK